MAEQNIEDLLHIPNWNGWTEFVGATFNLVDRVRIVKHINDFSAQGVMNDNISCSILRIGEEYYDLVSHLFQSNNPYSIKIHYLSRKENSCFLAITERSVSSFDVWIKDHPIITNNNLLHTDNFVYPFRCLLKNVLHFLDIYPDFSLHTNAVFITRSQNGEQHLKLGVILPSDRDVTKPLSCAIGLVQLVRRWLHQHGHRATHDLKFMLDLLTDLKENDVEKLKLISRYLIFYVGNKKELVFHFVIKADLLLGHTKNPMVNQLLEYAFYKMGITAPDGTSLEPDSLCWRHWNAIAPIRNCWAGAPGTVNYSVEHLIIQIQNLATHIFKYKNHALEGATYE